MAITSKIDSSEIGKSTGGTSPYINDLKDLTELKFRVIGDIQVGYQYFQEITREDGTQGVKPVRSEEYPDTLENPAKKYQSEERVDRATQFMAMAIYDFSDNKIKIWNLSKKSVISSLMEVENDEDTGEIQDYDFKVKKSGNGLETEYALLRLDKTDVTPEMQKAYEDANVDLKAYLNGESGIGEKATKEVDPSEIDF